MSSIDINEADVIVLSEGLKKLDSLYSEMSQSLKKISSTTSTASQLFTPILKKNQQLNILQYNIESSLNSVASVKDLANDASKHEIILEQSIAKVGLKPYINAIHKIDDILEDLNERTHSNDTSEFAGMVTHLKDLIFDGERNLQIYFNKLLNSIQPFDPQINMNKKIPFPYYDDEYLEQMSLILDYFENSTQNEQIVDLFIKQRVRLISQSLAFLEPFTKQISSGPNVPYQKGSSGVNSYTEAMLGFIANENSLIQDLYSKETSRQPVIYAKLCSPIIQNYLKIIKHNRQLLKDNRENIGLFSFELSDKVNDVLRSLRGKNIAEADYLNSELIEIQRISHSLFQELFAYINTKTRSMSQLPSDNGVPEPTVDIMSKIRKFSEYKSGCLSTIQAMSRSQWLPKDPKIAWTIAKNQLEDLSSANLLSSFFGDAIDYLLFGLERRAQETLNPQHEIHLLSNKRFPNIQRIGFFLLNNVSLIDQIVQRSEINSILGSAGLKRLESLRKKYINYYVSDWRDLTSILLDQIFVDSSGKVSSKEKDQIKDKFKKFHDGFEDLVSRSKSYRISDPALKKLLRQEILSLVLPMYERFYNRYKDSFKHPRKHIKYTPSELMNVLNTIIK
ncbi:Exo70 [Kluyveromyces lactis]|nr:Exo70 [Kluyveromyces lactis]